MSSGIDLSAITTADELIAAIIAAVQNPQPFATATPSEVASGIVPMQTSDGDPRNAAIALIVAGLMKDNVLIGQSTEPAVDNTIPLRLWVNTSNHSLHYSIAGAAYQQLAGGGAINITDYIVVDSTEPSLSDSGSVKLWIDSDDHSIKYSFNGAAFESIAGSTGITEEQAKALIAAWAQTGNTKTIPDEKFRHRYTINLMDSRTFEYVGVSDLAENQRQFRIHTQKSRDYIMIGGIDYDNSKVLTSLRAGSRIGIFTSNVETAFLEVIGHISEHGIEILPNTGEEDKITSGSSYRIKIAEIGVPQTDTKERIKELYESNADTNSYTDRAKALLSNIPNLLDWVRSNLRKLVDIRIKTELEWNPANATPGNDYEGAFLIRQDARVLDDEILAYPDSAWKNTQTVPADVPEEQSRIIYRRKRGSDPADFALLLDPGGGQKKYHGRTPADTDVNRRLIGDGTYTYDIQDFEIFPDTPYATGKTIVLEYHGEAEHTSYEGDVEDAKYGSSTLKETIANAGGGLTTEQAQKLAGAAAETDLRKVVRNSYQRWKISPSSPITQTGNGEVTTTLQFAEDDGKNVLGNNLPPFPLLEETPASVNLRGLLRRSASDNGNAQIQVSTDGRIIIDSTIDVESDDIEFPLGAVIDDVQDNRFSIILTTTNFQSTTTITLDDVELTVDELGDSNESPKRLPYFPEVKIGNVIELTQPYRDPLDSATTHQPGTYRCFTLEDGYERIEYVKEGTISAIHNEDAATERGIDAADVNIGRNTSRIADIENSVDFDVNPAYLIRNNTNGLRIGLNNFVPSFLSGSVLISLILFSEFHKETSQNGRLSGSISWTPGSAEKTFEFVFGSSERASISGHFENDTHIGVAIQFTSASRQIYKSPYKNIPILLEPPNHSFAPKVLLAENTSRTHAQSTITIPSTYTRYTTLQVVLLTSGTTRTFNITPTDMQLGNLGSSGTVDAENKTHLSWDAQTRVLEPKEDAGIIVSATLYGYTEKLHEPNILFNQSAARTHSQSSINLPANYRDWSVLAFKVSNNNIEQAFSIPTLILEQGNLSRQGIGNRTYSWTLSTRLMEPAAGEAIITYMVLMD